MTRLTLRIKNEGAGFSEFPMDADEKATILDLLETLRAKNDTLPAYRHSCHHGSCGTCGALINGREMLLCLTRPVDLGTGISDITLEPLRGMGVIAGIAVHPGRLFEGIPDVAYLKAAGRPERQCFEACIECGLCVSACPVGAPFIGPAALAALNREREKNPGNSEEMLRKAAAPGGAGFCERHVACSKVCTQAVYPARHIQMLKNALKAGGLPE